MRVLLFEREGDGAFRAAGDYSPRALVCANTHDLPTLAALWSGRDLELRRELELFGEAEYAERQRERAQLCGALQERLERDGLLRDAAHAPPAERAHAVHRFLVNTPAPLVGVALGDLTGEVEPVNIPGVPLDGYPSWSRRMQLPVEALAGSPAAAQLGELARSERPQRPNG